jgi:hypothetical protein
MTEHWYQYPKVLIVLISKSTEKGHLFRYQTLHVNLINFDSNKNAGYFIQCALYDKLSFKFNTSFEIYVTENFLGFWFIRLYTYMFLN